VLANGHTLTRSPDGRVESHQHWDEPSVVDRPASFDEGAEELRALLTASVDQRLTANGTTALWLSGGWDSSAILACATRGTIAAPSRAMNSLRLMNCLPRRAH